MSKVYPEPCSERPPRRPRYPGKNPRRFEQKYKELNPEKHPETIARVIAAGKTPAGTHRPICVAEILEILRPRQGDIAVDATLGFGGHATEILKRITPGGKLIGIDTDPLQLPRTMERLRGFGFGEDSFIGIHSNYAALLKILRANNVEGADLILADLGVSSMQLDDPARGFSFKARGPLDLRMNPHKGVPASALLAKASQPQIAEWLHENADEPRAFEIARSLVEHRVIRPLTTTLELGEAIERALRNGGRRPESREVSAAIARVFQALRIVVNDEFNALENFLRFLPESLKPGGRAVILTFHSGEDRRVKKAFAEGAQNGTYRAISREVVRPSPAEILGNSRAASAKLRWAVRS